MSQDNLVVYHYLDLEDNYQIKNNVNDSIDNFRMESVPIRKLLIILKII